VRQAEGSALRALVGAAVCVVSLVALTSAMFGFSASWLAWKQKIEIHATGPSTNNVGLRNVLAFNPNLSAKALSQRPQSGPWGDWATAQKMTFAARRPLFYGILLLAVALGLLACRGRTLE
jgi:low temperature requirement protein LtrA